MADLYELSNEALDEIGAGLSCTTHNTDIYMSKGTLSIGYTSCDTSAGTMLVPYATWTPLPK